MELKEKPKRGFSSSTWGFIAVIVTMIIIFVVIPAFKEDKQKDTACEKEYATRDASLGDVEPTIRSYKSEGWEQEVPIKWDKTNYTASTGIYHLRFFRCIKK